MTEQIKTGGVHHVTLTVSDVNRSADFYNAHLGFQTAVAFDSKIALSNGSLLLVLASPSDPAQAGTQDRFNENRIGLDYMSFSVGDRTELEKAAGRLDAANVERGRDSRLGTSLWHLRHGHA